MNLPSSAHERDTATSTASTTMTRRLRGVLAPVLTPFDGDRKPDFALFLSHCRWLLANGAALAIFGTNSEAASLGVEERLALTDALLEAGIPGHQLMPGTGSCSVTDAVRLTRHAARSGATGVLMLPPFYFKNVSEDGLFAYYAEVIEKVAEPHLAIYLYHIPQLTQVPITLPLIERLLARYPQTVVGVKDSSGDWDNTRALIDAFGKDGFDVFPGSESFLSRALPAGAAGCISATANVNPGGIRRLYDALISDARGDGARELQATADEVRGIFQSAAMIPAMKVALATFSGHAGWETVRPPLTTLDAATRQILLGRLASVNFDMPGLQ